RVVNDNISLYEHPTLGVRTDSQVMLGAAHPSYCGAGRSVGSVHPNKDRVTGVCRPTAAPARTSTPMGSPRRRVYRGRGEKRQGCTGKKPEVRPCAAGGNDRSSRQAELRGGEEAPMREASDRGDGAAVAEVFAKVFEPAPVRDQRRLGLDDHEVLGPAAG